MKFMIFPFFSRAAVCGLAFLFSGVVCGQTQTPPVDTTVNPAAPKPPFVARIPVNAHWRIDFVDAHGEPLKRRDRSDRKTETGEAEPIPDDVDAKSPVRIETEKTGNIRRDVTTYDDGSKVEAWTIGQVMAIEVPETRKGAIINRINEDETTRLPGNRFPGMGWISAATYRGTVKVGEVVCHYYEKRAVRAAADSGGEEGMPLDLDKMQEAEEASNDRKAMIAAQSRLPAQIFVGNQWQRYTFLDPPTSQLQIPEKFLKPLREYAESLQRRSYSRPQRKKS